jgi:hypothetical protein
MLKVIWKQLNAKWLTVFLLLLFSTIYFYKSNDRFGWTSNEPKIDQPIVADGSGYYAYLPQWYIYQTSNFDFQADIFEKYRNDQFNFDPYSSPLTGNHCNKYYPGTAIAMTPFFFFAHLQAGIQGIDQDGYSRPYLLWANIAGIAYFLLGCIACFLLFRSYKIERFWSLVGIFILAFATNLSFYANVYIPYSHVFSFAVIAWFIYVARIWGQFGKTKHLLLLSALLGFVFLIRPTNVMIVIILPFMCESTAVFFQRLKSFFTIKGCVPLLSSILLFGLFVGFQLWNVYDQSGEIALNTYKAEGFDNLAHPEVWNVLFSWSKGLFIFAPVLFLVFPGLWILFKKERRLFWGFLVFFTFYTYITASWWCWWYGGGLGMRPFIDVFAVLILPIVFLIQHSKNIVRSFLLGIIVLTTWMYQVYEFQMCNYILHYDRITKEQFMTVFMKEDLRYSWYMHLDYDTLPVNINSLQLKLPFLVHGNPINQKDSLYSGKIYGDEPIIGKSLKYLSPQYGDGFIGAKVRADVKIVFPETNPIFETALYKNGVEIKKYNQFLGVQINAVNKWQTVNLDIDPKVKLNDYDSLSIRFFEGGKRVYARNFKASFFYY